MRAVEVDRQQVDPVHVVLPAIGLKLNEQGLLGDAVGRVGLLGVTVPQVLLAKRNRRVLGVGADRSDADELAHARMPRGLDQLHAHHQIVVEELARPAAVGFDAPDDRGEVNQHVRTRVFEETTHVVAAAQVVFPAAGNKRIGAAASRQLPDDGASEETRATGNRHARAREFDAHRERPPAFSASASSRSCSTIMRTSSSKPTLGCQPSFCLARDASPTSRSTSAGRR